MTFENNVAIIILLLERLRPSFAYFDIICWHSSTTEREEIHKALTSQKNHILFKEENMMKSFFKKLAFVMALAMVVSMAAPAGSVFAATTGIAVQDTKDIRTEFEMKVEDTVDFCFWGAPKDWKTTFKWESSDESVATVDQTGYVTAVAPGTADITITAGADKSYVETVKITVKGDKTFEVKQETENSVKLTFTDKSFATTDITVEKIIKTTTGEETTIVWPVNTVKVDGNTATVTVWMPFGSSDYRFTANETSVDKYLTVGEPNFAVITYEKTYVYTEGTGIEPKITVYDVNGVKLSGYSDWYFELTNADADAYIENTTGNLYLWSLGTKAQVMATLTYVVGTETKTIPAYAEVTCVAEPVYEVNSSIEKYALVADGTAADKIEWNNSQVIIDNGSYWVAAIVKDSLGKTKSISSISVDNNNGLLANGYSVRYASSNPEVALVDENSGEVIGLNKGAAYVLVTLYKTVDGKDVAVGVIAAIPVNVVDAKKASAVSLDKATATLLDEGDFTKVTVKATVKDQYKKDYADTIKSVSAKVKDVTYSDTTGYVTIAEDGKSFTIDAKKFKNRTANAFTFTVEMNSGLKATFVLTVKSLPAKVNKSFALVVKGADVKKSEAATVEVVSAWAGSNLNKTDFYYGRPDEVKENDLYVTITGPDGKELTPTKATTSALSFNSITSDTTTSAALKTMATGKYIVNLYKVTKVVKGSDNKTIVNTTLCNTQVFEITNSLPTVTDFTVKSKNYTSDVISTDTVSFKVNGTAWDGSNFTVANVNKKELAGSCYVYDFTVQIPFGDNGAYYEAQVTVNKLFTLK